MTPIKRGTARRLGLDLPAAYRLERMMQAHGLPPLNGWQRSILAHLPATPQKEQRHA